MYKIFINEKPFLITASDLPDARFSACKRVKYEPGRIGEQIRDAEGLSSKGIILLSDDPEKAFKEFYSQFVSIEAAGGLVSNSKGQVLLIKRMGKWDLPKGKIDSGESVEDAALREVKEECGIDKLKLGEALPNTYHTYKMHNHRFLKITYWFKMRTEYDKPLVPQLEEQITEAKWFDREKLDPGQLDTYFSIKELLQSAL